jgi:RNA polymerase sigma-70 factor (ECF subfamily)
VSHIGRGTVEGVVGHERDTDATLLTARGSEAFAEFYTRHVDVVAMYFRRRTSRPDLVYDLTAETFAKALQRRGSYDPLKGPAIAWLLGIARNLLYDAAREGRVAAETRRRLQMQRHVLDDQQLAAIDERLDVDLDALLRTLPPDQLEAVRRRVLDDEPYAAIAESTACSPLVARQRVSRGLAALRRTAKDLR